jgi:hypothetical protein
VKKEIKKTREADLDFSEKKFIGEILKLKRNRLAKLH